MSVNGCPDDVFWTTEYFVAKLGMMSQHHDPECHAEEKKCFLSSRSRLQWGLNMSFYYIFWTIDFLATKLSLMIPHHKPECHVEEKKKDYCIQSQGHSEGPKYQSLSGWYLLNCQTSCYQIWYCDASSWAGMHAKRLVSYLHYHKPKCLK